MGGFVYFVLFLVRWVKGVGTLSAPGVLSALDINSRQFGLNEGESHQRPLLNIEN